MAVVVVMVLFGWFAVFVVVIIHFLSRVPVNAFYAFFASKTNSSILCMWHYFLYFFFCFSPFVRSYSFILFVLFGVICCCCIYGFVQKKETSD